MAELSTKYNLEGWPTLIRRWLLNDVKGGEWLLNTLLDARLLDAAHVLSSRIQLVFSWMLEKRSKCAEKRGKSVAFRSNYGSNYGLCLYRLRYQAPSAHIKCSQLMLVVLVVLVGSTDAVSPLLYPRCSAHVDAMCTCS